MFVGRQIKPKLALRAVRLFSMAHDGKEGSSDYGGKRRRRKEFNFQEFERERREQRQQSQNQHKPGDEAVGAGRQQPSLIQMPPQVAADLNMLNLPKYVSRADLKKQYHTMAKKYHPDATPHGANHLQDKFKLLSEAYARVETWVDERDRLLEEQLKQGTHASGFQAGAGGEVTYKLGRMSLSANRRDLDKQKLLAQMIEDETTLGEPYGFVRWMWMGWAGLGMWYLYDDYCVN